MSNVIFAKQLIRKKSNALITASKKPLIGFWQKKKKKEETKSDGLDAFSFTKILSHWDFVDFH